MTTSTKLIANLALDAAALGYEDADIRFAVMMASHVTNEDLIRDYFEREFPREWPPAEVQAARDAAEKEETRKAKKAAKRRRYRANRAAAKKAAAAGTSVFDYGTAEPQQQAADDAVADAEAGQLLSALFKLAIQELDDDEEGDDCDCHFCDKPAPKAAEEDSDSDSDSDYTDDDEEEEEKPLPDVQKLTYKDATTQSSVIRLKRGGVMEVRRNELTGAAIPDRKTWPSAEAWRASLPSPNATFDEDGVYISAAYTAAEELKEAAQEAHEMRQHPSAPDAEAAQQQRVQTIRERLAALKAKRATAS
jgi:hypothetical protein